MLKFKGVLLAVSLLSYSNKETKCWNLQIFTPVTETQEFYKNKRRTEVFSENSLRIQCNTHSGRSCKGWAARLSLIHIPGLTSDLPPHPKHIQWPELQIGLHLCSLLVFERSHWSRLPQAITAKEILAFSADVKHYVKYATTAKETPSFFNCPHPLFDFSLSALLHDLPVSRLFPLLLLAVSMHQWSHPSSITPLVLLRADPSLPPLCSPHLFFMPACGHLLSPVSDLTAAIWGNEPI